MQESDFDKLPSVRRLRSGDNVAVAKPTQLSAPNAYGCLYRRLLLPSPRRWFCPNSRPPHPKRSTRDLAILVNPHDVHELLSGKRRGLLPSLLRCSLTPLAWIYSLGVALRNRRFDQQPQRSVSVPAPVISVGNITTGGTGKTPMVEWIAKWYRQRGVRVALLSRGYGAEQGARNDEAMELEERLPDVPHLQNPDRVASANVALQELASQILLLDDGFQHRRLRRDLDIVLIDALAPFGLGHVLPRGFLREPLSGLNRADVIVLSRADLVSDEVRQAIRDTVKRHAPETPWAECRHRPLRLGNAFGKTRSLDWIGGRRIGVFCGIGNPNAFRQTVEQLEPTALLFRAFPDHHAYEREDIEALRDWAQDNSLEGLLCTHKDLVKIGSESIGDTPLWAVWVGLEFSCGESSVVERLEALLPETGPADSIDDVLV